MTDIRKKARVLLNAAREAHVNPDDYLIGQTAVCLAIEQHEAFRQEVSDAVVKAIRFCKDGRPASAAGAIGAFVIPKPKPDPLVDVVARLGWDSDYVAVVRATLDFFGLEIREKGQ